jgi:hypothetical protein
MSPEMKLDPATLAEEAAIKVFYQQDVFERLPEDADILGHLDKAAAELDLIDRTYWVETSRGMSLPVDFESDEQVRMINFAKLSFEGIFACYSKVMIGRIIGGNSVRALCLTFHNATLLPYFEQLPDRHLLYVCARR